MELRQATLQSTDEIFQQLKTDSAGLHHDEIKKRQLLYGLNKVGGEQVYWWHILLRQFTSPFLYLLLAAGGLSFFLGEKIDGYMIFLFVLINSLLGFYQEFRSEQTLKLLKRYIQFQTKVIREGKELEVNSSDLVPGDIVLFEAGDIVPADIRLIDESNLTVDESVLTGESAAVTKIVASLSQPVKEIYKAQNICFSGTTISSGKGKGVVLQTGKLTEIGQITKLTVETHRESSFEKSISRFSTFILYVILITLAGVFFINILIKGAAVNIPDLLIFSIALAVSVIPEALPIVITFSLSRGALRLAKNKVVVKRLSAIEDLGSIEVLCTDKTGTLTENQLTLHEVYGENKDVVLYASLASTLQEKKNQSVHSFDIALSKSLPVDMQKEFELYKRTHEQPFDPVRKRSSMLVEKNGKANLVVRGAYEEILKICTAIPEHEKVAIQNWIKNESGNRVIAVAMKPVNQKEQLNLLKEEDGLIFMGLISFIDPIKKTAYAAVKQAEVLGVKLKVLTGDSKEVAGSVAYEIGLISEKMKVLTGDEFESLSSHKQHEAVHEYSVFARVSPQQKYHIIQLLQEKNEVGFLGEGINDAPALKIANVAIVVQEATDVAREAADIILLKKSLRVIIDGIKEGRETFANTSKYIKATLSSNFGNFYTVAISSLFITFLPLLPLQILLINLLTDFPMIAVAADSVDQVELKSPRSYDIKEIALFGTLLGIVSTFFDFIFFALFFKISPQVLQTNWFIGSVLTELLFLFSIRTRLPFWQAKTPAPIVLLLSGIAFITAIILPFTGLGHTVFNFITPTLPNLVLIMMIVCIYFISTEVVKLLYYKFLSAKAH